MSQSNEPAHLLTLGEMRLFDRETLSDFATTLAREARVLLSLSLSFIVHSLRKNEPLFGAETQRARVRKKSSFLHTTRGEQNRGKNASVSGGREGPFSIKACIPSSFFSRPCREQPCSCDEKGVSVTRLPYSARER